MSDSLQTVSHPPLPSYVTVPEPLKRFLAGLGLRVSWQRFDEAMEARVSRMGMRPLMAQDIKQQNEELYNQVFRTDSTDSLDIAHGIAEKLTVDSEGRIRNEDVILCVSSQQAFQELEEQSRHIQAMKESSQAQETEQLAESLERAFGGRSVHTVVKAPPVRDQVEIQKDLKELPR